MTTMKHIVKIDPYGETITIIPFTQNVSTLMRWVGGPFLGMVATGPNRDSALISTQALAQTPYPPAWRIDDSLEIYYGTGLWVNVSPEGLLRPPLTRLDELIKRIEFLGFVQPQCTIDYLPLVERDDSEDHEPESDDEAICF